MVQKTHRDVMHDLHLLIDRKTTKRQKGLQKKYVMAHIVQITITTSNSLFCQQL